MALVLSVLLLGWMFPFGSTNAPETINSTPSPTPNIASTEVQSNVTPTVSPATIAASAADRNTITNSIGMEFVQIPAGEFYMGSPETEKGSENEGPVHRVNISKPFYMGKYEVTQEQWRDVMGSNPSNFKGDDLPVEQISWNDAQDFIRKLNEKEGTTKYRLPSEAEWEYAARAGTTTVYPYFGDDSFSEDPGYNQSKLSEYVWYDINSNFKTHQVGKKKPNPWGLYDMHGNVWEWVQDKYYDNYNGAPIDGNAWESGDSVSRVRRGCGWNSFARLCRSASRYGSIRDERNSNTGLRLVRDM